MSFVLCVCVCVFSGSPHVTCRKTCELIVSEEVKKRSKPLSFHFLYLHVWIASSSLPPTLGPHLASHGVAHHPTDICQIRAPALARLCKDGAHVAPAACCPLPSLTFVYVILKIRYQCDPPSSFTHASLSSNPEAQQDWGGGTRSCFTALWKSAAATGRSSLLQRECAIWM